MFDALYFEKESYLLKLWRENYISSRFMLQRSYLGFSWLTSRFG